MVKVDRALETTFQAGEKTVRLLRDPVYGHWRMKLEQGTTPPSLSGSYLTREELQRAVLAYYTSETSRWKKRQSKSKVNEIRRELGLKEL